MPKASTSEFSADFDSLFGRLNVVGTSIGARCVPDELLSPMMSLWTTDREAEPEKALDETNDGGELVARRSVSFGSLTGVLAKRADTLMDEKGRARPWFRLRAVLASPDGVTLYHATAMCTKKDLKRIEAALEATLASIEILAQGEAAIAARNAGDDDIAALVTAARKRMDEVSAANQAAEAERRRTAPPEPVADIETRFKAALKEAGLSRKAKALRKLASPSLSLTELRQDDESEHGRSRIGGGPDLPEGTEWPRDASGLHYNFLAQIDLADLPAREAPLPAAGLLSFYAGSDLTDWHLLYVPPGASLVHHALPEDADDLALAGEVMTTWDRDAGRCVIVKAEHEGIVAKQDADGRASFFRNGELLIVLASQYDVGRSVQRLRFEHSLTMSNLDEAYVSAGIEDWLTIPEAVRAGMAVGDGPQHQMFGFAGHDGSSEYSAFGRAATHAKEKGWSDLDPSGWFVLLALQSGGEVDFNFWDHGMFAFMAHAEDTARGDFSRVFAFVESS